MPLRNVTVILYILGLCGSYVGIKMLKKNRQKDLMHRCMAITHKMSCNSSSGNNSINNNRWLDENNLPSMKEVCTGLDNSLLGIVVQFWTRMEGCALLLGLQESLCQRRSLCTL